MSRKKAQKQLQKSMREIDNTRGSKLWAFNHFRSPILTSLLNDLVDLEREGLEDRYCNRVGTWLEYFTNYSTEFPRGGFMTGPIFKEIEQFTKLYRQWNEIKGSTAEAIRERRQALIKLRKQRQNITDKSRRLQFELDKELDQKLLAESYRAIGELIQLVPNLFQNLANAYDEYRKRGGSFGA